MPNLVLQNQLTLLEIAKRKDPNGNFAVIAEILDRTNAIMKDVPYIEANGAHYHKIVKRHSLPAGEWRKLNAGVGTAASDTTEVTETIGMLEQYSEVDKVLIDIAANPSQARMSEAAAFLEGMGQTWVETLFYGNGGTDPEKFTGLMPRLNDITLTNVLGCLGTGSDLTSAYIVAWGQGKCFGIYPKGHPTAGVEHKSLGEQTKVLTSTQYQIYRDHFKIYGGLAVADDRHIARLCNIESSGPANLFSDDKLIQLLNGMPANAMPVIYVNKTLKTQMDIDAKDKANVNYTTANVWGVPTLMFRGVPVKICEGIVNTEDECV